MRFTVLIFRNITKIDDMLETPALETTVLASAQQETRIFVVRPTNDLTELPVRNIRRVFSWRFVRINSDYLTAPLKLHFLVVSN
jgi:hypothetical protein